MKVNALVMSRSQSAVKALIAAFAQLGIEYKISTNAPETIETVVREHYSALITDFDVPAAVEVAKMARTLSAKRRPVLFGMIGSATPVGGVFEAGANFVLYKPLDASRQKSETLAYLQFPTGIIPALVLDVTEQGLSVQAPEALVPLRSIPLRFLLPGTAQVVYASGDFIWADATGRAGLFFKSIAPACRLDLQAWLKKRGARRSDAVSALLEPQGKRNATAAAH
jgi:CheY-like chemotaxis protein